LRGYDAWRSDDELFVGEADTEIVFIQLDNDGSPNPLEAKLAVAPIVRDPSGLTGQIDFSADCAKLAIDDVPLIPTGAGQTRTKTVPLYAELESPVGEVTPVISVPPAPLDFQLSDAVTATLVVKNGDKELCSDTVTFRVLKVELQELHESANPMNSIPNDFDFDIPGGTAAFPKRPGWPVWDVVQIDKSHVILIASDSSANPDPTINATWNVKPPSLATSLRANATYGIVSEVGLVALTSVGGAQFQLPVNDTIDYKEWNVFVDDPHILDPASIGQIVLISHSIWLTAATTINAGVTGYDILYTYPVAQTIFKCFLGVAEDAVYCPTDYGTINVDRSENDIWYQALTHKVGLNWTGDTGNVPVRRWGEASGISLRVVASPEFAAVIRQVIDEKFDALKPKSEGYAESIPVSDRGITFEPRSHGGSSDDLALAIHRARLSGTITAIMGPAHADPQRVNIAGCYIALQLTDLCDFDYFGGWKAKLATITQAGWQKYDGTSGGKGNIYFVQVVIDKWWGAFTHAHVP
jgi:hypothetical protein